MALEPDDTVCFCFHVSLRKVQNFCRINRPKVPSQISECLSAGTGCGWCVGMLKRVHQEICGTTRRPWDEPAGPAESGERTNPADAEHYAEAREKYLAEKRQAAQSGGDPA